MANARLRRYFRHGLFPQILAFEACVRLGSVTRAADELCLAQPTVSCLVRKLSDTFGGPLTVYRDRRIAPTALGREVLALCRDLTAAFERFDENGVSDTEPAAYDLRPAPIREATWHSDSPRRRPSHWKPRALPCPLARRKRCGTTGAS